MTRETAAPPALAPRPGTGQSADGTRLGWWSVGSGPGLLVVHGAMQSGLSQLDLARELAGTRTVHLLDRRGRGCSGPWPDRGFDPSAEVADVIAAARATGSTDVLGVSSGAILALRAALADPGIERVAAFEPPIVVAGSIRMDQIERFGREYAEGRLVEAMVTAMRAAQMGPAFLRFVPRGLLRAVTGRMLRRDDATTPAVGVPHLRELARALPADMRIVAANAERAGDFAGLRARTALLAGSATRPYLRAAVDAVAAVIPGARTVVLTGTNHAATQNRDQYGRPERVAPVLAEFFGA